MISNIKQINNSQFERILIKTHKINFGENIQAIINQYVKPQYQENDILAISEKIVSVCQNNVRHISTVKVSFLAKLITKFVKKYPNDIGFSLPAKMQVAIDIAGYPRMILAIIIGGILKLFGKPGYF
ncbi:MAG: coenzyme F420-0:L-glutamate ligase [Candidatus Pacebacteria bacterium]|nr:coenzyme F420-0:L-glutamate ligase [Candidatus Paceibacterota bacterium]